MKNIDFKKVLNLLGVMLRCPVCGHKTNLETMSILESEQVEATGEGHMLIHADCQKCHGNVMFDIGVRGPELMSSATVTDLTLVEMQRLLELPPISVDEVLDMHNEVREFAGDFVNRFRKPEFGIKALPKVALENKKS